MHGVVEGGALPLGKDPTYDCAVQYHLLFLESKNVLVSRAWRNLSGCLARCGAVFLLLLLGRVTE